MMPAVVSRKVDALQAHGDAFAAAITAFDYKIHGTEPRVVAALVPRSFARIRQRVEATGGPRAPPLPGCQRILDGNHLAATERRRSALRGDAAGPLSGLARVALDVAAMMRSDAILREDGHASAGSLTAEILVLVGAGGCRIADRNFCAHGILFGLLDRVAAFALRQHGGMEGQAAGPRLLRGRCEPGEVFEQPLELASGARRGRCGG